ncbi:MAG: CoA transferase [Acidimicrobiales bacterium]|jgi:crotonobetainyl-CoA:carnitine CoA-transferase CaiB-like acyl-CoA transferase
MLSPYRVLDLTDDRGHFAGFLLAQMGADVIAVEPPEGSRARHQGPWAGSEPDPEKALGHWAYNRGKRSVVANEQQLEDLAANADVIIECGAMPIDLAKLRAVNPALITASLSPFGADGPKSDWLGTDLTLTAASGQMSLNGYQDRAPTRITAPQVWVNTGSEAACAVMIALTDRRSSGVGQHIEVSAQEATMLTAQGWLCPSLCDNPPARRSGGGLELQGILRFRFVYECMDGHVTLTFLPGVLVGAFTNRVIDWSIGLGDTAPELGEVSWATLLNDYPIEEAAELANRTSEGLARSFLRRTKAELFEMAQQDKLLLVPVTDTADVLSNEHYAAREFWDEVVVDSQLESVRFPGPWAKTSTAPLHRLGRAPHLGEHTDEVLSESPRTMPVPSSPTVTPERPLEGLRVIDFTWVYAGPFATRMLAYYGAEVIRLESQTRPDQVRTSGLRRDMENDGPENSQQWHSINADKLSVQINLKIPESRQVVLDLARSADVVINAFSPGVLDRVGLSHAELLEVNPTLIAVSTTLFGQSGPLSPIPGFGNMGAAMGGYYELTGWPDRLPAGPFLAYTDATSPRLTAALILAALDHRARTGEGCSIDFSQAEGGIHFLSEAVLDQEVNENLQSRMGNADRWMAPHSAYPCGEPGGDEWIAIACETDEQWSVLAGLLERGDLATLAVAERLERESELDELVAAWTAGKEPLMLQEQLQAAGVPAHHVQNSPEVIVDPQLLHRDHFREVPHPEYGHTWAEQYGFRLSRSVGTPRRSGPTWGEHNFEVLTDVCGYDGDQIADLVIAGVLE